MCLFAKGSCDCMRPNVLEQLKDEQSKKDKHIQESVCLSLKQWLNCMDKLFCSVN